MLPISRRVRFFTLAVIAVATLGVVVFADRVAWHDWPWLLMYFYLLVRGYSFRVSDPRGASVTPSAVLTYLIMYVLNPPTALLLAGVGRAIGEIISRRLVPWRAAFNGAQLGISVALGAAVYKVLGGSPERVGEPLVYVAFLAAPFVYQVANHSFVSYFVSQWRETRFLGTWFNGIKYLFWENLFSIPTAFFLAILYFRVHFAVLAYLVLFPFQRRALELVVKRRELNEQIVDGLVAAIDVNFRPGKGHARRVADRAESIARELHLNEIEVESIRFAALLHDVGMIGKDDILERAVLRPEDVEDLRDHVRVGADIARELPRKEIATMILRHHERYDGGGYPGGLKGEAIPLGSRIIALAEVVESMASGAFPYTSPVPMTSIVSYVSREGGRSFDPEVVDAFLRTEDMRTPSVEVIAREGNFAQPRPRELPAK